MWLGPQWVQAVTGIEDKSGRYGIGLASCGHARGPPGGGVAETGRWWGVGPDCSPTVGLELEARPISRDRSGLIRSLNVLTSLKSLLQVVNISQLLICG